MTIRNTTRGTILAQRCRLAAIWIDRLRGVMLCEGFEPHDGCWLERTGAIHTALVRWPLDVVFLSSGVVVGLRSGLQPWRLAWVRGATDVVELPVGTIASSGTEVGDRLVSEPGP